MLSDMDLLQIVRGTTLWPHEQRVQANVQLLLIEIDQSEMRMSSRENMDWQLNTRDINDSRFSIVTFGSVSFFPNREHFWQYCHGFLNEIFFKSEYILVKAGKRRQEIECIKEILTLENTLADLYYFLG